MAIPSSEEIRSLLDRFNTCTADELESQWLDFKPWSDPKQALKDAIETAVCFANAEGGLIVFGVSDKTRGRTASIHGIQRHDLSRWQHDIYDNTNPNLTVEVEELSVPEGTGILLLVRVSKPKDQRVAFGTAKGLYKIRIGKSCMPLDPVRFSQMKISTSAVDWSGEVASGVERDVLDPLEIARARSTLRSTNPDSELLKLPDVEFLEGLEGLRGGRVTNTGLILFGHPEVLARLCPQSQMHYVHQVSDTKIARNDVLRSGLLNMLDFIERLFSGPTNPEEELSLGLFKLRIPAFPLGVVREAVLNAVTHRDYADPGEVLIRHSPQELVVTNPGGFVGGITLDNFLRHEPVARNRTLANAFLKLRLVESAGTGRRRIFHALLGFGKRMPRYETDGTQVTLRIFDGSYDQPMAGLVAKWNQEGKEIELDTLMVLSYLKENAFIDTAEASHLLQLPLDHTRSVLDRLSQPVVGLLERRGQTRAATYHLSKGLAKDLLGKTAYTRTKGIDLARYAEIVRQFVSDYGKITPRECRELLGLGDSSTARVQVSQYLKKWSSSNGFLRRVGSPPRKHYYVLNE